MGSKRLKLTAAELKQIGAQRARSARKQKVRAAVVAYKAACAKAYEKACNDVVKFARYDDCNCPSAADSCWDCAHCLRYRVRCGDV